MPKRWNLSLYRLRQTISGIPSDFQNVIRESKSVKVHYPIESGKVNFEAKLVLSVSKSEKPSWVELFDDDFTNLRIPNVKRVDGLLLVKVTVDGETPIFAFSFGQGRHLLKPEAILPSYGLGVALNAMYRGGDDKNLIRSVDSKTIDQNVFNTRRQADRRTSFDSFLVDTRHDFLRRIMGKQKWSGKFGQRAKMYPTRTNGYENDKATELFRPVQAAVALEALRGDKTVQEIAAKRQLHPTQVSTWKRQAIEGMAGVFSDKVKKAENKDGEIKELHAKIGQLAVENDFLSQGLKR